MKVIYMGTPDFAVGPLESMIQAGIEVALVVTQPDKAKGRSAALIPTPVKECALKYGIEVFQPEKIKTEEAVAELAKHNADLFVVAAFGQILSKEILDMPRFGCINIHASLLPKYRGAAPIQWSIIDGEKETGVTIMQMNEGLDTGDILTQKVVPIEDDDIAETLFDKLCEAGGQLLLETLPKIEAGAITPVPQEEEKSCYAKMLSKQMGEVDFSKSAKELWYLVRGLNSWPCAYTYLEGKSLKLWQVLPIMEESKEKPGTVVAVSKDSIDVACGEGLLRILEIQLEGKKRMSMKDFMLGRKFSLGQVLGK